MSDLQVHVTFNGVESPNVSQNLRNKSVVMYNAIVWYRIVTNFRLIQSIVEGLNKFLHHLMW